MIGGSSRIGGLACLKERHVQIIDLLEQVEEASVSRAGGVCFLPARLGSIHSPLEFQTQRKRIQFSVLDIEVAFSGNGD
jgi:hypothetical protein